jgi:thiol-disulfide isomerase/thioredoxin
VSGTLNFTVGEIAKIPVCDFPNGLVPVVEELVALSRVDWDNVETSWDFRDQPLLRPGLKGATLAASWQNWEAGCQAAIRRMQELETENNRLFITAYGLQDELKPEVPEDQITLARVDVRKDMAAFLSYALGCMMGRYSLDAPGLILANAGDTVKEYLAKVNRPFEKLTFTLDEDGIIPVLDGEWFEDDIVSRTRDFLRATFGEATLRENLRFIEDSLGRDLRKYFLNDFYKDHLQTYKKRPIYWLVQSPTKGFSVLIYLHRYTKDTMNLVLNRYLRDYQAKLRNRLTRVTELQVTADTAREKTEARREVEKLTKILSECDEWERQTMLPLAQARIELNLDDGVKVNYLKLGEALAPIAGLVAKEEE